jgi:methyltransferase (TIGR00027 family)
MKDSEPSRSAMSAAVARGIHRLWDDPPWVLDDPFALPLVGNDWRELAQQSVALARPPHVARAGVLLRSRYPEDVLARGSYAQYVILAAGLDSFAWREPGFLHTGRVFEVDHPATQRWKRSRATTLGLPASARHAYVPVDFAHDALDRCLTAAGLDWSATTLFSWVGATMYLERAAIADTLRAVARCARGSGIVLSYNPPRALLDEVQLRFLGEVAQLVAGMGEPLRATFTPDEIHRLASDAGLEVVEEPSAADLTTRYLAGRRDGMLPILIERLLWLRV